MAVRPSGAPLQELTPLLSVSPLTASFFLIQGLFTFPKIHPFKVYNSVTFSVFTSLCSHHQLQNICHPTKKPWLHLKTAPLSPASFPLEPMRPRSVLLGSPVASLPVQPGQYFLLPLSTIITPSAPVWIPPFPLYRLGQNLVSCGDGEHGLC